MKALVNFGATWAGPVPAIALFGVADLSWWKWAFCSGTSEPDDGRGRVVEVAGHLQRARRISQWTQAALLIGAGAAALVVGIVLQSTGVGSTTCSMEWPREASDAADNTEPRKQGRGGHRGTVLRYRHVVAGCVVGGPARPPVRRVHTEPLMRPGAATLNVVA